jgi:hypothetical protein
MDKQSIVTSAARIANGNSSTLVAADRHKYLNVFVNVTAQSGTTPTMDLRIDWSLDGTNWYNVADSFTQIGAVTGSFFKQVQVKAPYYRLVWTLGGTSPNYTFSSDATLQV